MRVTHAFVATCTIERPILKLYERQEVVEMEQGTRCNKRHEKPQGVVVSRLTEHFTAGQRCSCVNLFAAPTAFTKQRRKNSICDKDKGTNTQ